MGRLLEMERTAINIYKKRGRVKVITSKGPTRYFLNLRLMDKLKEVRTDYISENEDYLRNFNRYIIMDFIKKNELKTKFGFIHIPKNYNSQKATRVIQKIISEIKGC